MAKQEAHFLNLQLQRCVIVGVLIFDRVIVDCHWQLFHHYQSGS
jgi:hypothetical protein